MHEPSMRNITENNMSSVTAMIRANLGPTLMILKR